VILSSEASAQKGEQRFNREADGLNLMCPACGRQFSVSIFELEWFEVEEDEFKRGFLGAKRAQSRAQR
jgi:hypothetical protein